MNKSTLSTGIVTLLVGIGIGYGVTVLYPKQDSVAKTENQSKNASSKKILFYRNAMNPAVTSPVPSKDAMGMDYIPVYAGGASSDEVAGTVTIDPTVVQNIGVRTALAKRGSMSKLIRAVGRVAFDEERMARLHPKVEGWVDEIFIDKTGDRVKEGEKLVSIYSPQLVSTQEEYLLALRSMKTLGKSPLRDIRKGAQELLKSSRERLVLLDVPEHQIVALEKTRKIKKNLHIHSPVDGTVLRIGFRKGQYITSKTELYMIVDLKKVWVYAEIYEYELPWVKEGDTVEMTLASVPGKVFKGTLAYIYPYAEAKTRTTKVRLVFDNKEDLLRPDMFSEVRIKAQEQKNALYIPSEAVIRSGDETQVFLVRGVGKYEPRLVTLGIESQGKITILSGLKEGDEVVTSAQFLIDSESKLREATAKMMDVKPAKNKLTKNNSIKKESMKMDKNTTATTNKGTNK